MEHGSSAQGITQAIGVRTLLRQGQRLIEPRQPLVRIAQGPQRPSSKVMANHASVVSVEERSGAVLLGIVQGYPLCKVCERRNCRTQEEQRRPYGTVRRQEHGSVLGVLREGQKLLTQGVCRLQLGAHVIIIPQATQHGEKLLRVFQVFTELASRRVDLSNFRSRVAFGGNQRCS